MMFAVKEACLATACGKLLIAGSYLILEDGQQALSLALKSSLFKTTVMMGVQPGIIMNIMNFKKRIAYSEESNEFVCKLLKILLNELNIPGNVALNIETNASESFFSYERITVEGKTGIGSSAALAVSLTKALHMYAKKSEWLEKEFSRDGLFFLAFYAHSFAQGKVGSGFDVATASLNSSILYTQCNATLMKMILNNEMNFSLDQDWHYDFMRELTIDSDWDVVMAGWPERSAHTPTMISQIMSIKQKYPKFWLGFKESNAKFIAAFLSRKIEDIRLLYQKYRSCLQELSVLSNCPIEPPECTLILDDTQDHIEGVIICGVSGAGGYDALFCLCSKSAIEKVRKSWRDKWNLSVLNVSLYESM